MLTVNEIKETIEEIKKVKDDFEKAHVEEDTLWQKVLRDIATGKTTKKHQQELAKEALKTTLIVFNRVYA